MANTHYEKYSTTIKKVARRNYRKRVAWLNDYLADESCVHCGESETVCLKFYPHDVEIRKQTKRKGMNQESRKDVIEFIMAGASMVQLGTINFSHPNKNEEILLDLKNWLIENEIENIMNLKGVVECYQ